MSKRQQLVSDIKRRRVKQLKAAGFNRSQIQKRTGYSYKYISMVW